MPTKTTQKRSSKARRQGKSSSTQAGEFVREEIDEIRAGKHGARSAKQAIAIGLSKARRAGVKLAAPKKGRVSEKTRRQAKKDLEKGQSSKRSKVSAKRSRASTKALKRESGRAASKTSLSRQSKAAAKRRTSAERSRSAKKAARTRAAKSR